MPDLLPATEVKDIPVAELYAEKPASTTETSTSTSATETSATEATSTETSNGQEGNEEGRQEGLLTLKDRVSELGFKDVADDADAQQRLFDAYQQQVANQQQMQQQMEMLRYQMAVAQGQQAQPQQQAASAPPGYWNPPKGNEQLRQQFVSGRAEDGSVQWKTNTPPQIISEYEAEEAYYRDHANRLVRNWGDIESQLETRVLEKAKQLFQAEFQQQSQRQQADTFVQTQLAEHEDVFYQKDPVTKSIRTDFRGEPMLTEAGVRFDSILNELANNGMVDETARWKYAQQIYKAQYGDFRQQATQKIQQARAAHVAQTQPAAHIPARNGQDVNGRTNGGRPDMQTLGQRFLAANEMVFN